MFTGIIETTGAVRRIERCSSGIRLLLDTPFPTSQLAQGDSLAVNGCCLTVAALRPRPRATGSQLQFDLLQETWNRTNFQFLAPSHPVNLERALRADGRLDGHFVTGHIDGIGQITRWQPQGADWLLEVAPPPEIFDLLVSKGSISIDGISLTVADILAHRFRVWIIPHTFEVTNLRGRQQGDWVNLESDLLGKYVKRFAEALSPRAATESRSSSANVAQSAEPSRRRSHSFSRPDRPTRKRR